MVSVAARAYVDAIQWWPTSDGGSRLKYAGHAEVGAARKHECGGAHTQGAERAAGGSGTNAGRYVRAYALGMPISTSVCI